MGIFLSILTALPEAIKISGFLLHRKNSIVGTWVYIAYEDSLCESEWVYVVLKIQKAFVRGIGGYTMDGHAYFPTKEAGGFYRQKDALSSMLCQLDNTKLPFVCIVNDTYNETAILGELSFQKPPRKKSPTYFGGHYKSDANKKIRPVHGIKLSNRAKLENDYEILDNLIPKLQSRNKSAK